MAPTAVLYEVFSSGARYLAPDGTILLAQVNADHTVTTETIVEVTSTAAARAITLPTPWKYPPGQSLTIKDVSGGASTALPITIAPPVKRIDVDDLVWVQNTLLVAGDISVDLATIAALAACTAAGSGVGKTLTGNAVGAVSVDGTTPAAAKVVLVKNQANAHDNGVYVVTVAGDGSTAFVLTRKATLDADVEAIPGMTVLVGTDGGTLDNTVWQLQGGVSRRKSLQLAAPNDTVHLYTNGLDWHRRLPAVVRTLIPEGDTVVDIVGAATPTDGTTGLNISGPGSIYRCTGTPGVYINTGSAAVPAWKAITHA